ncbi:MAG: glycosyltransferase [Clostridia bacterium]|nr:glycosyltransferase [Clostridia bacterium]
MTKVSVIVPVYNVEKFIDKCLKSLVNQTLQDIEIIIVNDGTQDKSIDITEKYVTKYYSKVKYYEKKNGGLSSARNYGLEYATGEYVAFLDSDDYVEKNMYEEMYNLAKKENADMVECDFIWEWKYGKKIFDKRRNYKIKKSNNTNESDSVTIDIVKKKMMKKPRVVAWNKIYKRDILNKTKTRFPEGLIYEDLEFFYKLLPYLNKISYINKYFVHYTQRDDSISNTQTEKTGDIFKILDNILVFYKEKNIYNNYKNELKYMSKRILIGSSLKRILKIENLHIRTKMILKTMVYLLEYGNNSNFENIVSTKNNKLKICFGITKLGIGGAERVLIDVANVLSNEYDITIFTIYGGGELEKELNTNIKTMCVFNREIKNKFIPIYVLICGKKIYNRYLRKKFDIDIAFLEGPITRIFSFNGNKRKIAWIHNDISKVFGKNKKAEFKRMIDKWFYKKYDQIIFVSRENKKVFENVYGDVSKRKIIYNYINKDRVIRLANRKCEDKNMVNEIMQKDYEFEKNFVVVSRLVKQKAIDRLIRVHKRLIDEGLKHKIYVLGDGEEKENLLNLVEELNVNDSFIFLGQIENPYPYIKKADYFGLFSYFEGYGMVLEEAKILNKPILVTNTAAAEAVKNYDRKLVIENNEEAIFESLKKIILGECKFLEEETQDYNYDNKYLLEKIKGILYENININCDIQ